MIDRINLILAAKNLTAKQFAEEIGIQPSGMSHILSGRNNPSLDFVMKVMRRYPEINLYWLLNGEGEMYELGASKQFEMQAKKKPNADNLTLFDLPPANETAKEPSISSAPESLELEEVAAEKREAGMETFGKNMFERETTMAEKQLADSSNSLFKGNNATPADSIELPVGKQEASKPQAYLEEGGLRDKVTSQYAPLTGARESLQRAKRTVRIVVFYSDNTFAEYLPE